MWKSLCRVAEPGATWSGPRRKHNNVSTLNGRKRRVRIPRNLAPPPEDMEFAWARRRPELARLDDGEVVRLVMEREEWRETVGRILDRYENGRKAYTLYELESVELLQRAAGFRTSRDVRNLLASDRGRRAREILGFHRPRNDGRRRRRVMMEGIPSEASLARYRDTVPLQDRRRAYEECFGRLVKTHLPSIGPQLTHFSIDGTDMKTCRTCPKYNPRTGELLNAGSITCPDGGFRGGPEGGHGWHWVAFAARGLPLDYEFAQIQEPELEMALTVFKRIWPHIRPYPGERIPVLNADGAFSSHDFRREVQNGGLIPIIHMSSHGDSPRSRESAQKRNDARYDIRPYQSRWFANGHHEFSCACGEGVTWKRIRRKKGGTVAVGTEGRCSNCGPLSITAGQYRYSRLGYVPIRPDELDRADWSFGNPFTFNDPLAKIYGEKRFGHGEGMHGALERRFGLISDKRDFSCADEARLEVAMVFSIVHALAMERMRLSRRGA